MELCFVFLFICLFFCLFQERHGRLTFWLIFSTTVIAFGGQTPAGFSGGVMTVVSPVSKFEKVNI